MSMDNISCVKSSLTNMNHLSDDVLIEIFIRLPSRSVSQSKTVSKRWRDLISSHSFIHLFISHHHSIYNTFMVFLSPHELMLTFPPPLLLLEQDSNHKQPHHNDLSLDLHESMLLIIEGNVCGSSNGLFLCSSHRYTSGRGYYVHDPMTKECFHIPSPPVTYKECIYAVGFVCEPLLLLDNNNSNSNHAATPISNRSFRAVIIPSFIVRQSRFRVEVFSSDTKEWIQQIVSIPKGFAFAPHWLLSYDHQGWLYFMGRTSIFVYDPYGQDSDTLDYPLDADPMNIMSFGFLGTSCGNLRIADISHKDVKVWELVVEEDRWHLIHKINLLPYLPVKFCADYYKRIGGFHPHDGDIVYLCSYADGVFVANLRTHKFEAISGYDKCDMSPFQLELPLSKAMTPMPSPQ